MRFFNLDLLAKGSFQTTPDGQRLFYPNGLAGKGYLVESEERYQHLFRQQKYWGLAIMASITLMAAARLYWPVVLGTFITLNLLKQVVVRRTTRQMQPSPIPYSVNGFFREGLRLPVMRRSFLLILCGSGLLVSLSCLAALVWYPDLWRKLLGWATITSLLAYLALRDLRGMNTSG